MDNDSDHKPAPGQLELIYQFLNTWSAELGIESLATPRAATAWLRAQGLWAHRRSMTDAELATLVEFRSALRAWVRARTSQAAIRRVNRLFASARLAVKVESSGMPEIARAGDGIPAVIGHLAGIIHTAAADGTWERFKCCALPTCGWAFYDHTRNRSGRWCSMKTCGSRHKAREYLKRQKALAASKAE